MAPFDSQDPRLEDSADDSDAAGERQDDHLRGLQAFEPYLIDGNDPWADDGSRANGNGGAHTDTIAAARRALAPVQQSLSEAGFYAYGTLDDQHRWTIAADDEAGRIDVRLGADGFALELWGSSPGLYADEENTWRRRARERLARMTIPNIARGYLEPHQTATWDEIDQGVAVRICYEVPFTRGAEVGALARARLKELEHLLTFIEKQLSS